MLLFLNIYLKNVFSKESKNKAIYLLKEQRVPSVNLNSYFSRLDLSSLTIIRHWIIYRQFCASLLPSISLWNSWTSSTNDTLYSLVIYLRIDFEHESTLNTCHNQREFRENIHHVFSCSWSRSIQTSTLLIKIICRVSICSLVNR